jgi:hypothetical protein
MGEPGVGGRTGLGWFQTTITLEEPYVPRNADASWFNASVVEQVRESMSDADSVTVLLTGRSIEYAEIIKHIVAQYGLRFDEFGFKDRKCATLEFKTTFITNLIEKYSAKHVEMWDDRPKQIDGFNKFLRQHGISFHVHRVDDGSTNLSEQQELELVQRLSEHHAFAL